MSEAVLDQYWLEDGVYRLGQFSPISVRDQIVRANYLIDLLSDDGQLAVDSRLVIVGAGAAGVAAALAAARRGVQQVLLLEKEQVPLALQARCSSRWLDPTQYDWPADHWRDQSWPLPEAIPRSYTAVSNPFDPVTASLAWSWSSDFSNRLSAAFSRVRAAFDAEVQPWTRRTNGEVLVPFQVGQSRANAMTTADILIVTVGFGSERSDTEDTSNSTKRFVGLDFWATDHFEHVRTGIPKLEADHVLFVSGAGDGALQDFIRLSTGRRAARDILDAALNSSPASSPWRDALAGVWHWEDQTTKALPFAPSPVSECEILSRLHQRYVQAVDEFAASLGWPAFCRWLQTVTRGRRIGVVKLLMKCTHFGVCYPLNHVTALLLLKYFEQAAASPLLSRTALKSTAPRGHSCSPGCWGLSHEVRLARGTSCSDDARAISNWPAHKTDVAFSQGLVIRHGIAPLQLHNFPEQYLTPQPVPPHLP
jgi:hypothetical protein